jgi:hypothetical protein
MLIRALGDLSHEFLHRRFQLIAVASPTFGPVFPFQLFFELLLPSG